MRKNPIIQVLAFLLLIGLTASQVYCFWRIRELAVPEVEAGQVPETTSKAGLSLKQRTQVNRMIKTQLDGLEASIGIQQSQLGISNDKINSLTVEVKKYLTNYAQTIVDMQKVLETHEQALVQLMSRR